MLPRIVLIVAMTALAAACAREPTSLTQIAAPPPEAAIQPILVATTRERSADTLQGYSARRATGLSFAEVTVSIPPDRAVGQVRYPRGNADPRRAFTTAGFEPGISRRELLSRLNARLAEEPAGSQHVFLYVHGYNTDFAEGVFLQAQIAHDFGTPGVAVNFSWPSAGIPPAYLYDRESAQIARDSLVETLQLLAESDAVDIAVVAHSMGGVLIMEALRQLSLSGDAATLKRISTVVLASPDIDEQLFNRQFEAIDPRPPAWVIFVSRRDRALRVSSRLRGGELRVGLGVHVGKLNEMGIAVIDLTDDTSGRIRSEHTRFASSPLVIAMLQQSQRLRETFEASEARGFDEALAGSVGELSASVGDILLLPQQGVGATPVR